MSETAANPHRTRGSWYDAGPGAGGSEVKTMLTKTEMFLAGRMLMLASEHFENHGCNDPDSDTCRQLGCHEWLALGKRTAGVSGDTNLDDAGTIGMAQRDDLLMGYLADVLLAAAQKM